MVLNFPNRKLNQLKKLHNDPVLWLYGSNIPIVPEAKFLGIIFDRKLSFIPHIKYLMNKCLKALNLLKLLSHTNWGADRITLLQLYRSLIQSKLHYGQLCTAPLENHTCRC